jgi:hypothetical protein
MIARIMVLSISSICPTWDTSRVPRHVPRETGSGPDRLSHVRHLPGPPVCPT